jgi:hypothetical protein
MDRHSPRSRAAHVLPGRPMTRGAPSRSVLPRQIDDCRSAPRPKRRGWVRSGSNLDALLADACVVVSCLIQHGAEPHELAASMGRLGNAEPASVIGAVLDLVAAVSTAHQATEEVSAGTGMRKAGDARQDGQGGWPFFHDDCRTQEHGPRSASSAFRASRTVRTAPW